MSVALCGTPQETYGRYLKIFCWGAGKKKKAKLFWNMSKQGCLEMPMGQGNAFTGNLARRNAWQNRNLHKTLSRKMRGKKTYPSPAFFCHRWFSLASTSHWIWIGWNLKRAHALKKKWLIWGKQTSAASFQALWFVALVGRCTWKFCFSTRSLRSSRLRELCFWLVVAWGKRGGTGLYCRGHMVLRGHHQRRSVIWVHLNKNMFLL